MQSVVYECIINLKLVNAIIASNRILLRSITEFLYN